MKYPGQDTAHLPLSILLNYDAPRIVTPHASITTRPRGKSRGMYNVVNNAAELETDIVSARKHATSDAARHEIMDPRRPKVFTMHGRVR